MNVAFVAHLEREGEYTFRNNDDCTDALLSTLLEKLQEDSAPASDIAKANPELAPDDHFKTPVHEATETRP